MTDCKDDKIINGLTCLSVALYFTGAALIYSDEQKKINCMDKTETCNTQEWRAFHSRNVSATMKFWAYVGGGLVLAGLVASDLPTRDKSHKKQHLKPQV